LKISFKYYPLIITLLLVSCKQEDDPIPIPAGATPYDIEVPFGFPQKMNIPENNPMTVEGVELGRYLFYDGRVSGRTHPICSTILLSAGSTIRFMKMALHMDLQVFLLPT